MTLFGAVAVGASVALDGKNAFKAANSRKSVLNSLHLKNKILEKCYSYHT